MHLIRFCAFSYLVKPFLALKHRIPREMELKEYKNKVQNKVRTKTSDFAKVKGLTLII